MDIHPPAGAIRSFREYAIHLSMVVIGILIALGLEGAIERHHDHQLAVRAEREMITEIRENRSQVTHIIVDLEKAQPELQSQMDSQKMAIEAERHHQPPPSEIQPPSNTSTFPTLSSAAWDSALAMQAVGRIDIETTQRLSRIYSEQRDVKESQQAFLRVALLFSSYAGREANDVRQRMIERLGALSELSASLNSVLADYHELLLEYDQFLKDRVETTID